MSTVPSCRPGFFKISSHGARNCNRHHITFASWTMAINSRSFQTGKKEKPSTEHQKLSITQFETTRPANLHFNRLQTMDEELILEDRIEFGHFMAREVVLDEEYWTAAWLRAETHWEDKTNERYIENYKRKFAEQEFNALKRRCRNQHRNKCTCIVTVRKKEKNVQCTVLKSVVGTLDLSIRYLLPGETFPGEREVPVFCSINRNKQNRYGYIANLCVAKTARRQGIASTMLHLAIRLAKEKNGAEQVYVHVHRHNRPARDLYEKIGFKVVGIATPQLEKEQIYLLCYQL